MKTTKLVFLFGLVALFVVVALSLATAADEWDHVESLEVEDPVIRSVWAAFVDRLNNGDIDGALEYYVPDKRDSVRHLYEILGDEIKKLPDNWSDLAEPSMYGPFVEYKLMDEANGMIHSVTFLKMPHGPWLINGL